MIKAKKIGLIINEDITIETKLKNGMVISVVCQFIDADYDRLYLLFPKEKQEIAQYFYEGKTIIATLNTINEKYTYPAKILYEPQNNLIVIEYYYNNENNKKRNNLRVNATKIIDVEINENLIPMVTINISAGGIKALSSANLETNKKYTGYLSLYKNRAKIKFEFKVIQNIFLENENKYETTFEFVSIKETDRKIISKFCFDTQTEYIKENIQEE